MRTPANAFKGKAALNIKCNSTDIGGGNELMVSLDLIPGILKLWNSNNFFTFSEMMKTLHFLKPVNMIRESKSLCENFHNQEHIFPSVRSFSTKKIEQWEFYVEYVC